MIYDDVLDLEAYISLLTDGYSVIAFLQLRAKKKTNCIFIVLI